MNSHVPALDETHDPALESWVESANDPHSDFPLQNLPFGRFRLEDEPDWRIGVAIGSQVLDLRRTGLINFSDINRLMRLLPEIRRELRAALSAGLSVGSQRRESWARHLHAMDEVELGVPCAVGHRIDCPGGAGRTTTVGPGDAPPPSHGVEWQLGAIVGRPNAHGHPIPLQEAENHVFGLTLLHDWSACEIQLPAAPPSAPARFGNLATRTSPWIVTLDALAPFRAPYLHRDDALAPPADLDDELNRRCGAFKIDLAVRIQGATMQTAGLAAAAGWTVAQLVTHHTRNGRSLSAGDLLGTGALLAGPRPGQAPSLRPGDSVTLSARCHAAGRRSIGFGPCGATVPAPIREARFNQEQPYADLPTRKRDPATGR